LVSDEEYTESAPIEVPDDIEVCVAPDRLVARLSCTVPEGDRAPFVQRLLAKLDRLGLHGEWDEPRLTEWLDRAIGPDGRVQDAVLAEGIPPVQPEDGRIEWTEDFFAKGYVLDEATGRLDYRRRAAHRTVYANQLLARIRAPREGSPGQDVFGKPIPTRQPKRVRIRTRSKVTTEEEGQAFYAASPGTISWQPDADLFGGVLSVDELFTIPGSVDLKSGDVRHPGAVLVEKDVQEGASIEADGDIEVHGIVEPANITTPGSLIVGGGITGGKGHKMVIGGEVHAKFILDAEIEAGGDIVVERGIINSTIRTRGAVMIPDGRLIGGILLALKGVTCGMAGSEGAVKTTIITGIDFRLAQDIKAWECEIQEKEAQLVRIEAGVKPWLNRLQDIPEAKKPALQRLIESARELTKHIEELRERIQGAHETSRSQAVDEVVVRKSLFPDTVIGIGDNHYKVEEVFPGPVAARLGPEGIEITPVSRA